MNAIEVVYSDNTLLVVNKPAGLLSVPGRGPGKEDCVVSRVNVLHPSARSVHRLDCATSGLMVLAHNADSHRALSRQFQEREVAKRYIACVSGALAQDEGEVNAPLMADWPNRPRQMVHTEGKQALTYYRCLSRYKIQQMDVSRVELKPVTGRSHQLRVHMLTLGHAILGDQLYARGAALDASPRLMLHAQHLSFFHPDSKDRLEFEIDAPF